jgi:hypothetical protein
VGQAALPLPLFPIDSLSLSLSLPPEWIIGELIAFCRDRTVFLLMHQFF